GYKTYKCARCADIYEEITADPAGHNWGGWTSTGTSTVDGKTVTEYERTCSVCSKSETKSVTGEGEDAVTVSEWDGETVDYGNLIGLTDSEETAEVSVSTAAELAGLAAYVNGDYDSTTTVDSTLSEVEITLDADINLSDEDWTPIGENGQPFSGTFDGNNCTISNLNVEGTSDTGLFGYIDNDVIKDVTIENATVAGTGSVGVLAGQLDNNSGATGCVISGITIKGLIQISGYTKVGVLAGSAYQAVIKDVTIEATEGSYVRGIYAVDSEDSSTSAHNGNYVGGLIGMLETSAADLPAGGYTGETPSITDVSVSGLDISGTMYVGGIVGYIKIQGTNGFSIVSSEDYEDGYNLSDCTISITVVNDEYMFGLSYTEFGSDMTYVGAVFGYTKYATTVSNFTINNITVKYYDSTCVYAGTSSGDGTDNAGFYGGKSSGITVTLTNCTGSATLIDLLATD
ncbi:MAG: hypothetical protein LUE27_11070, partial [Clostridia bacterium]|nr:hypothetical protein [Clostridia bacterium]